MRIMITIAAALVSVATLGQTGYKIDFSVTGLRDTTAYLGYYYGESQYVRDTARVNSQGIFSFDGKQKLPQGLYFLVVNNTKLLDIVISDQQHFSMTTSTAHYIEDMKVKGDEDNTLFYQNMIFNLERHQEADPYIKILQDSTLNEDQKKDAREAFQKINARVMAHQNEVIEKYPDVSRHLFSALANRLEQANSIIVKLANERMRKVG